MNSLIRINAFLLLLGLSAHNLSAQEAKPLVHPLFSSHMVLQRDKEVTVWGWAKSGSSVKVEFANQSKTVMATADGKWQSILGPFEASSTGRELRVMGNGESETFDDVLVGDVWICSGQSNMEWPVAASNNAAKEIAAADHPHLRFFTVPRRISTTPQELVEGQWSRCSSRTVRSFSAVGYFFGRQLNQELKIPIGLIHTSWGGTVAEAWTSAAALKSMGDFDEALGDLAEMDSSDAEARLAKKMAAWWEKADPDAQEAKRFSTADFDDSDWGSMNLPTLWEKAEVGMDQFDGIVWFRREFELPSNWRGDELTIQLGAIDDADTTWVNGHEIGSTNGWQENREYDVDPKLLKPGRNVIAVRVYDGNGDGGIYSEDSLKLIRKGVKDRTIPLSGEWKFKVSRSIQGLAPYPQSSSNNPNVVAVLHNGMFAPLVPYGIRGAIWYQGESNAGRPAQYRRLLPTMIKDWRTQFDQGDFPFLVVQLANFMQEQTEPVQSGWAELREAQTMTANNDPNVGLAIITDIGEANDIHPRNKQDVGKRLALQALEISYDKELVSSGPTLSGMSIIGDSLGIDFANVGGGLVAKGGPLRGFAIAEKTGDFVWAEAEIEGNTVILWNEDLAEPIRVRYNWANNPVGNLFNKEGLPAAPFRTDRPR